MIYAILFMVQLSTGQTSLTVTQVSPQKCAIMVALFDAGVDSEPGYHGAMYCADAETVDFATASLGCTFHSKPRADIVSYRCPVMK